MAATQYVGLSSITGPLIVVDGVSGVGYDELVEVRTAEGVRRGKVIEIGAGRAVVQVFEGSSGIGLRDATVRFLGRAVADRDVGRHARPRLRRASASLSTAARPSSRPIGGT